MDELTIMHVLFWIVAASAWIILAVNWLVRRRLKTQHQTMAMLYSGIAKKLRADADAWREKAWDETLSTNERLRAYGFATAYAAGEHVYADVAADVEHVLVNGKTLESRSSNAIEEPTLPKPPPSLQNAVVFMSKGGNA